MLLTYENRSERVSLNTIVCFFSEHTDRKHACKMARDIFYMHKHGFDVMPDKKPSIKERKALLAVN
jgi:hypothetical protein